ncbi:MAG: flavin reductase [Bacteroidota bacterium]|jgi:flavin reductase (DIM6/NTAB) family NADH-FMN oxidoreductase RutF
MKKPWNIPEYPVYSLVSSDREAFNMNVCTYVIPVSMSPKLYVIAAYEGTKTLNNLINSNQFVLQLMHRDDYALVRKLGKASGNSVDKIAWLEKKSQLEKWESFPVLRNACFKLLLQKKKTLVNHGDHTVFLLEVIKSKSDSDAYLTTSLLREKKIIRA